MNEKLIVVYGAQPLHSTYSILQRLIATIYKYLFNYLPEYNSKKTWVLHFRNMHYDTVEFKWSGNILPYDVPKTITRLVHFLNDQPAETTYTFLTESIGTEIVLAALERANTKNVARIVAICPVNKPRKIDSCGMVVIQSQHDFFARFARVLLRPFHIFSSMDGNIERIIFKDVRHDQFIPEYQITQDKTLLEIVQEKLSELKK